MNRKVLKSKKQKIALTATTAMAAATSIVAPLATTSCSAITSSNSVIGERLDKQYGVSKEVYEDMKTSFIETYAQKLKDAGYNKGSSDFEKRMNGLLEGLKSFDEVEKTGKYGYTVLTNALIDFARTENQKYPTNANSVKTEPYDIKLERHTRAKWSDLNDVYDGMADSFRTYMHNNRMPASTIKRVLADANAQFKALKGQLQSDYGNDALSGLLKAKEKVITFFDVVNDDIALISSTLRLKDFLSEFTFEVRQEDESNCIDLLMGNKDFKIDTILTNDLMNTIFTVTRNTTGQTIPFDAITLVPGYTVQPKLKSVIQDDYANTHNISIDFGLVKNTYVQKYANNPEKLANVTGHLLNISLDAFDNANISEKSNLADVLRATTPIYMDYVLRLTAAEESRRLQNIYFNDNSSDGKITFKWDMNNQAYECFFDNAKQSDDNPNIWVSALSTQSLANAGLMISSNGSTFASINNLKKDSNKLGSYKNKVLASLFLENCMVYSIARIDETNPDHKVVTHEFKACYLNTTYGDTEKYNCSCKVSDLTSDVTRCVNFKVSPKFFDKVNVKFNECVKFVSCYDDSLNNLGNVNNGGGTAKNLGAIKADAKLQRILKIVFLVANGVSLTILIATIVRPIKAGLPIGYCIAGILLGCLVGAIEGFSYYLFKTQYYDKVMDYINDVDDSKNEIRQSSLMALLKKDLRESFVLINDDGSYNMGEYAKKLSLFNRKSMNEMLTLYRTYSTISEHNSHPSKAQLAKIDFDSILAKRNISPERFDKIVNKWKLPFGTYWVLSLGLSVLSMIGNLAASYFFNRWYNRNKEDPEAAEAAETINNQVDADQEEMEKQDDFQNSFIIFCNYIFMRSETLFGTEELSAGDQFRNLSALVNDQKPYRNSSKIYNTISEWYKKFHQYFKQEDVSHHQLTTVTTDENGFEEVKVIDYTDYPIMEPSDFMNQFFGDSIRGGTHPDFTARDWQDAMKYLQIVLQQH